MKSTFSPLAFLLFDHASALSMHTHHGKHVVMGPRVPAPDGAINADYDAQGLHPEEYQNLKFTTLLYSNLGGLGPATNMPEGLRYGDVTELPNGKRVDAHISAIAGYKTAKPEKNGLSGTMGVINVLNGYEGSFKMSFFEAGTNTPVQLGKFFFSISDMDQGKLGGAETLTIQGFDDAKLLHVAGDEIRRLGNQFMSTTHGVGADNPNDPLMMTDLQAARTVAFKFPAGMSSLQFKYHVDRNADKSTTEGRHFLFAGLTSLYFCEAQVENVDFFASHVVHNNLGNQGPNFQDPEGLRYGGIVTRPTGQKLDLTINAMTPYQAFNSEMNGKNGKFGNVHLKGDSDVRLKFTFVEPGTTAPVSMDWFYFTWYDMDHGKKAKKNPGGHYNETIKIGGFATHYLTETSEVTVTRVENSEYQYSSTQVGNGLDNPSDPMALTKLQKDRGVTFLFHNTSTFEAVFANGKDTTRGRNFLFAGKSSEVFC